VLFTVLVFGLAGGLVVGSLASVTYALFFNLLWAVLGFPLGFAGGFVVSSALGLVWTYDHAWVWYQLARANLAIRRQLPWSLMTFLAEAHRLGVIRQAGSSYQFRHARLQDHLASPAARHPRRGRGA
jgi:hypothetical protein